VTLSPTFGPGFGDYALLGRLGLLLETLKGQGEVRLPPETELCRRLEVDRARLRSLLQTLSREGVLNHVRSKGWYFSTPKLEIPVARHNSYTANMRDQHQRPRSEVLGIDQEGADQGRLWVLDFRRYNGDLAVSLARVKVPVRLTPGLNLHLGRNVSLYQTLEAQYGIRPERRHTWCEAVAADPVVAEALEVPLGSPLLKTTHQADWAGEPFEQTTNFLRADACRIRVDLAVVEEETP